MLLLSNVSSREWVEKGGGIIITQLHLLKFLWRFNRRGSAFRRTLFHIRKLLITWRNGSSGVHNPKWWIIHTPFTFAFEMYFWTWVWIEIWDPRIQRVLSFLSFLYTPVFRKIKRLHVWVLRPFSTGVQVKLQLEKAEMVAMSLKIGHPPKKLKQYIF